MESDDPVGQVVAMNLKRLRQRRRYTLKDTAGEIAASLGSPPLSEAGFSRWESATPPRRFAMTELFAICRVFEVPLAVLFLPDIDAPIPTIQGEPFFAVWNACFDSTDKLKTRWQQVDFVQSQQLTTSDDVERVDRLLADYTAEELAEAAAESLRRSKGGD